MKFLLVHSSKDVRHMIAFALENRFGVAIQEADTLDEALQLLRKNPGQFSCVIADYQGGGKLLMEFLRSSKGAGIQGVLWSEDAPDISKFQGDTGSIHFVRQTNLIENLCGTLQTVFKDKLRKDFPEKQQFSRIRTSLLVVTSPLNSDIYIALSPRKHLKLFQSGDVFDLNDFEKYYTRKKLEYFYLKSQDLAGFTVKLTELLLSILEEEKAKEAPSPTQNGEASPPATETDAPEPGKQAPPPWVTRISLGTSKEDQEKLQAELAEKRKTLAAEFARNPAIAVETVQEISNRLGFSPEVQELAKASVQLTIMTVKKSPRLSSLLATLDRSPEKYIASHSMLTAQLSCMLASKMDWKSDQTLHKLTLAAMLHDIILKNQELAAIDTLQELNEKQGKFTPEELTLFKKHPIHGADLVRQFSDVPPDVDQIILEHHERPDGSGFPRGLAQARIGPLSTVFIVAHDLVQYLFQLDTDINQEVMNRFFELNKEIYQLGNFKKILRIVPKLQV